PSASCSWEPEAEVMKGEVPPTEPKARTGEFTPPGMKRRARSIAAALSWWRSSAAALTLVLVEAIAYIALSVKDPRGFRALCPSSYRRPQTPPWPVGPADHHPSVPANRPHRAVRSTSPAHCGQPAQRAKNSRALTAGNPRAGDVLLQLAAI